MYCVLLFTEPDLICFLTSTLHHDSNFPSATQALDVNQDDKISREEFTRALTKGGAVQLMGWGVAGNAGDEAAAGGGGRKRAALSADEREAMALESEKRLKLDEAMMEATRVAG